MLGFVFWDELAADDQAALEAISVRRTYERGAVLFMEGDRPTHVIVLLAGSLKLTRSSAEGRTVLIEIREPGALIGESGPIDQEPRSASAIALSDIDALVTPADAFVGLLEERGSVAIGVISTLAQRLRESAVRRLESGTSDAVTRLAGRLVELSANAPTADSGMVVINSSLTQQELAEWIGVSRDAVVLAFRQLRELSLIETGRQQVRIIDPDGLRRFARPD